MATGKRRFGWMKTVLKVAVRLGVRVVPLGLCLVTKYWMDVNEWAAIGITAAWVLAVEIAERLLGSVEKPVKAGKAGEDGKAGRGGKAEKAGEDGKAGRAGKAGRIFGGIVSALVLCAMVWKTEFDPGWNTCYYRDGVWDKDSGNAVVSREEAMEDLDYVIKYLKKIHPLTLHGLPEEMAAKEKEVREWIKGQEEMEGYVLARELESIAALLGDGHTHVEENYPEYHLMKHIYEHNKRGDTMVGINGERFEEFLKNHPGLCSYELEAYGVRLLKNRIVSLEGLKYLGIDVTGDITYNYVSEKGEEVTETVRAEDFLPMEEYLAYEEGVTGDDLRGGEDRGFVYYDVDEELSLAVLTLTDCNYNKTYRETVRKFFDEVAERNLKTVAVDLRNNSGGSSMVANEFISYLAVDSYKSWGDEVRLNPLLIKRAGTVSKNWRKGAGFSGKVYVLTGVRSYSSAMDFAMLIQDNGIGKLIGEPCGNLPASYGDVKRFQLPNSGLVMQVSMKRWHRVDETKEELPLIPDVECPEEDAMEVLRDQALENRE